MDIPVFDVVAWRRERLRDLKQTEQYRGLPPDTRRLVDVMVKKWDSPDQGMTPSQETVAKAMGWDSRRTVMRHLKQVVAAGVFTVEIRPNNEHGNTGKTSNRYRVNVTAVILSENSELSQRLSQRLSHKGVSTTCTPKDLNPSGVTSGGLTAPAQVDVEVDPSPGQKTDQLQGVNLQSVERSHNSTTEERQRVLHLLQSIRGATPSHNPDWPLDVLHAEIRRELTGETAAAEAANAARLRAANEREARSKVRW